MWLLLDMALVALGVVLMVVLSLHAYSRFRRMNRFGTRAGGRVFVLAEQAGQLGERMDAMREASEATAEASRR